MGLAQPVETLLWMRIFDVCIPIVTSILAMFIIYSLHDTEEEAHQIRKKLEERRGRA